MHLSFVVNRLQYSKNQGQRNHRDISTTVHQGGGVSCGFVVFQLIATHTWHCILSLQCSKCDCSFDRTLGGHAMEIRLRDHLVKLFKENHKTQEDVSQSPRAVAKFLKEAARVKQVLSANTEIYAQVRNILSHVRHRCKNNMIVWNS